MTQPDPCGASCETAEDATAENAVTARGLPGHFPGCPRYNHGDPFAVDSCDCAQMRAAGDMPPTAPPPKLRTVPTTLREANAFVALHHRHHKPVRGHTSSTAVVDDAGDVRGVAIIGRPLARKIDHRQVCEVLRVATDGCANACSALYGACCRIAKAFGYARSRGRRSARLAGSPSP